MSDEGQAVSPDEAQAAVQEQLGQVAESVTGSDVVGQPVDVSQAAPAAPNVDDLLAQVQAQAAQLAAIQEQINAQADAVKTADVKPPSLLEALASSTVGSQVAHLVALIDERLSALESHSSEDSAE